MRLLLTYLVIVGVVLAAANYTVQRLRPAAAVFLALLPLLFLSEAIVRNGIYAPLDIVYRWEPLASYKTQYGIADQRTPLLVDVVDQHIPWRKAVRDAVKHARLPLWNRFQMAGEPLLAVQMPAVLFPGTWLGFGLPLAHAWTLDMALRIFLALLAAFMLLRDMGCSNVASCFGGTAWALCDFLIFSIGYPHGAAAAALPLLVLGLRRIAIAAGRAGPGITVAATALIISAGHPETSLHAIAAGGVFFLSFVVRQRRGQRARPVRQALLSGLLGVGLMAVTLVPFLEILPHTFEYRLRSGYFAATQKSVPLRESLTNLENQVVPFSRGVSGHSDVEAHYEASGYSGSLVLVFAAVGLCIPTKDRLPLLVLGIAALLVAAGVRGAADAVGNLPLFDIAINQRLIFASAFCLAIFAGIGLDALLRQARWRVASGAAIGVGLLILTLWAERRPAMLALRMPVAYMNWRLALELLPVLGLLAATATQRGQHFLARYAWALPLALAAVRYPEIGRLYSVAPAAAFYPPLDVLAPIPRDQPVRFAAFGLTFIPNMAALYELEDVRAYDATTLGRLVDTFPLWCVAQPVWFNRVDDPTKPFLSFLGVRYFLAPPGYGAPPGWRLAATGPGGWLLENDHALPRAFIPQRVFCDPTGTAELAALQAIRDFHAEGTASLHCSAPGWLHNGSATVAIRDYKAGALRLAVEAESQTVIATSIPAWPGWQIHVDGRPATPLFYNHAFLGVQVPAGRHLVALRYLPRGFLIGGAVSLAAALALLGHALSAARQRWTGLYPQR